MNVLLTYIAGLCLWGLSESSTDYADYTDFSQTLSAVNLRASLTQRNSKSLVSVSVQLIERRIYLIRGQKVMIDEDLAELYGVPTKRLNQQVSRNRKRFPDDFMFRLNKTEADNLRLQFVTSRSGHGRRRSLPYVFTEQGVAMLSSVLNSESGNSRN